VLTSLSTRTKVDEVDIILHAQASYHASRPEANNVVVIYDTCIDSHPFVPDQTHALTHNLLRLRLCMENADLVVSIAKRHARNVKMVRLERSEQPNTMQNHWSVFEVLVRK
jgi:hypothetical protein